MNKPSSSDTTMTATAAVAPTHLPTQPAAPLLRSASIPCNEPTPIAPIQSALTQASNPPTARSLFHLNGMPPNQSIEASLALLTSLSAQSARSDKPGALPNTVKP